MRLRRILTSLLVVGVVSAAVIGGVTAFFSDTETSTGNILAAGAIDLQVDNSSYGFDWNDPTNTSPTGVWGQNNANSWTLADLTDQLFFNFHDLKPGDYGEDTISLHVNDNDAYACMAFGLTGTPENGLTEPEADVDATGGVDEGELQNYLSFLFWHDDGDNVLEEDEQVIPELSGLPGSVFTGEWLPLAEGGDTPLPGDTTQYIGKGWCFGTITPDPTTPADNPNGPTVGNTGFTCSGAEGDHNDAQTDGIVVDVAFHAIQSRNNEQFTCASLPPVGGNGEPEGELVGAALGGYDDPATCDLTVIQPADEAGEHTTLASALSVATDGNTICVDPSYTGGDTFPVSVSVPNVTIAGLGAMGDANIPGGLFIENSGVTIMGLEFTDHDLIQASAQAAIYIHNEVLTSGVALTGTDINHNIFTAPAGAKAAEAKAIITEIGSAAAPIATGLDIMHNVFDGWRQAMFFNTAADYEVAFNDILNNDVGVANDGPHNASIHNNDFEGNVLEAVGIAQSATNGTTNNGVLTVNTNNFTPAGVGNDVNQYLTDGPIVDATNNWWAGEVEAARTNDTAQIDTEPAAAVAFPEN